MQKHHRILLASGAAMLSVSFACMTSALAAKPVEFKFQSAAVLQSFVTSAINLKEVNKSTDMQKVTHVRMQQTYAGYPVLGGDVIVHTTQGGKSSLKNLMNQSNATVNGVIYQELNKDLQTVPAAEQANKALNHALQLYSKKASKNQTITEKKTALVVFVDKNNKAHWAYQISFEAHPADNSMFERPTYIMDAFSLQVYHEWNDVKQLDEVPAGGYGGNLKMGKLEFDGLTGHLPKLAVTRDAGLKMCYLANADTTVRDMRAHDDHNNYKTIEFKCDTVDSNHNNIYWNADLESVNGGYSPPNDALYAGKVIEEMYQNWYGVPPLVNSDGKMMLNMVVHMYDDNAYWDGRQMYFGDGISYFYPLTSLGVGAHEISHGFTEQHSNLNYYDKQSGGLNESFSDMAAQAAEFYSTRHNSWQIGPEIFKQDGEALRYMDNPPRDGMSIGHMKDFKDYLDVHYTSGIYNKVFYVLGTSPGWDTKKAFDVMVKANMAYWRSTTDFHIAANCVLKAAQDLGYDQPTVKHAFSEVGIYGVNVNNCV